MALLFAVAACSPAPSPSVQPPTASTQSPSPVLTRVPSATVTSPLTPAPTASPTAFAFDVENRSHVAVVVSAGSDAAGTWAGFESGQRGTIVISLFNLQNGIGVEVTGGGCSVLASGSFPTLAPFTLLVEDGAGRGEVKLSAVAGAASTPLPLPTNSLHGCGG